MANRWSMVSGGESFVAVAWTSCWMKWSTLKMGATRRCLYTTPSAFKVTALHDTWGCTCMLVTWYNPVTSTSSTFNTSHLIGGILGREEWEGRLRAVILLSPWLKIILSLAFSPCTSIFLSPIIFYYLFSFAFSFYLSLCLSLAFPSRALTARNKRIFKLSTC